MEIDRDKINDGVLALLYLTLDRDGRAWKGFDWDVMDRLHAKGLIANPKDQGEIRLAHRGGGRALRAAVRRDVRQGVSGGRTLRARTGACRAGASGGSIWGKRKAARQPLSRSTRPAR